MEFGESGHEYCPSNQVQQRLRLHFRNLKMQVRKCSDRFEILYFSQESIQGGRKYSLQKLLDTSISRDVIVHYKTLKFHCENKKVFWWQILKCFLSSIIVNFLSGGAKRVLNHHKMLAVWKYIVVKNILVQSFFDFHWIHLNFSCIYTQLLLQVFVMKISNFLMKRERYFIGCK